MRAFDATFAAASRERCAPVECDRREGCWVVVGTGATLSANNMGTPRCLACQGRVVEASWRPSWCGDAPESAARERRG